MPRGGRDHGGGRPQPGASNYKNPAASGTVEYFVSRSRLLPACGQGNSTELLNSRLDHLSDLCWCWIANNGKPGCSYLHMYGGNFVYADGHARHKRFAALKSGDFGLNPANDSTPTLPTGLGHSGVCGKAYSSLF